MGDNQRALTRLLISTINARETEAARISRTLHDEVGQVLSAVGLQLDVMKLDFKQRLPEIVERTEEIQKMLDQAVQQVRAMSYDLNPAVVERVGLQFSLERLVGRYADRFRGSIRLLYEPTVRVPLPVGNAWYKIAEHALDNAVQHSGADSIEVQVRGNNKVASLDVRDNGKGFLVSETKENAAGLGLLLIDHYAAAAGVKLSIKSSRDRGTTVRVAYQFPGAEPVKTG